MARARLTRRGPHVLAAARTMGDALAEQAVRDLDAGREAPVVDRPDEWWAVPARLRAVH